MIGFRVWEIRYNSKREGFVLCSPFSKVPWERDMKAICEKGSLEEHLKEAAHSCGLYSYKSPDPLFKKWDILVRNREGEFFCVIAPPLAVGIVFHYGIVAIYSGGFRSSHCVIDTIFIPSRFSCRKCQGRGERTPAEFLTVTNPPCHPYYSEGYHEIPYLVCSYHYYSMKEEFIEYTRVFPIEAIRVDLEKNYQVPVRDLRDLF